MQSRQYTIGEFASINKISTRMLRHYDKIGLLKPAAVLANGYRSYSSGQIALLSQIRQYQSCSFTLLEIGNLLHADGEQIAALVKAKQMELCVREADNSKTLERLLSLSGNRTASYDNDYAISRTYQENRLLLQCKSPVAQEQIEDSFNRLYQELEPDGKNPAGLPVLVLEGEGDAVFYAAAAVRQEHHYNAFTCRIIPAGYYLSTLHFGNYDSIGTAYDCLFRYADEQNKIIEPPFMERYFLDRIHTSDPNEYITEISIKVTP